VGCTTCELVERRDRGAAPVWDEIVRTEHWDVVHCYGVSIEGWLVLACRRHVEAVADLSEAEAASLGPLLVQVSSALRDVVGAVKTYVVQYAEHPQHPHVHVHVIPRRADHPEELRGPRIFDAAGRPPEECVPEHRMDELALALRAHLA
jgi:diadenosine tetraphosphate (Ap4A) HIT family hydrolase